MLREVSQHDNKNRDWQLRNCCRCFTGLDVVQEEIGVQGQDIKLEQTGCIGMCHHELCWK